MLTKHGRVEAMSVTPKTMLREAAMKAREASKNVTITGLREAAVKAGEGSRKLVHWIDEARALAGTADFTKQLSSDLAALVADARKRGIDNKTIAANLREVADALGDAPL